MFGVMVFIGLALAVVGFSSGQWSNFWPPFSEDQNAVLSSLRFIIPGMTSMAGFGLVATLAEDAKVPPRRIGQLIVATVVIAGLFYCLVLAATATVLPWQQIAGMDLGTISAFKEAGFPLLSWGAYAIAIMGLLTSFLGLYMATSRIIVAMARVDLLPGGLAAIDKRHGSPRNALLLILAFTVGLGWLGQAAVVWFPDTGGIYLGLVWIAVAAAQYQLGRKYPHLLARSSVHVGFFPLIGAVGAAFVIILALLPGQEISLEWPAEYVILALWFLIGAGLYWNSRRRTISEDEALTSLLGSYSDQLFVDAKEKD